MSFGVTPTGFARKTLAEIRADLETKWRAIFGSNVDLSADTPDSQILGVIAGALDEGWQAAAAAYSSFRPSQAIGQALSDIVQYNGLTRKPGIPSLVSITITTTGSVSLTTAHRFSTASGDLFRPFFAGSFGNGSSVLCVAVEVGPISVAIGALNQIVTPVANLVSITNPAVNSSTGTLDESDAVLRARQLVSTENSAINILEALYASLLQLSGVTAVRIYVNSTAATVAGRPAKSYEVVIQGGDNVEIAKAIWNNHPAGIELFGTTSQAITDSQSQTQTIKFTRPTSVPIIVSIAIAPTSAYPGTGNAQMKQAIVDYAAGLLVPGEKIGIGDTVFLTKLYSATNHIPGHHVSTLQIGAPGLGTSDITIAETSIATFTTGNITVTP